MAKHDETDYSEDEYITENNDPHKVEKITQEDYTIIQKEEKIEFDETFETVRATSADFALYDKNQTKKILDSLKRGELRK